VPKKGDAVHRALLPPATGIRTTMTDKDDQQWLDALAGKPDASADPMTNAQAQALRTAMVARRAALEHATANADPAEFERLRARLQREGLLADAKTATTTNTEPPSTNWLGKLLGKWLPSAGGGSSAIPVWSLATNVVLGVVVVVQMGLFSTTPNTDADVLRGGPATVLLVANPAARLVELTAGLDQAKAHYVVMRKSDGEVQLLVQADVVALDYLQLQRIEPKVSEGVAVIVLRKPI
jgi:hypothetical protein